MTLPIDRIVTLLGNDASHPTVRTMIAALWVDRGNGIATKPLLQACHYVAQAPPSQRPKRAAGVLAHCASDEALQAFLDRHVSGDDWLETHHETHMKRMDKLRPQLAINDAGRAADDDDAFATMDRVDTETSSTILCRCGEHFSWEGYCEGLSDFIRFHAPHMRGAATALPEDAMANETLGEVDRGEGG